MNLAKALKAKNQLVGEINKLREVIQSQNVQLNDNTSHFKVGTAYADYVSNLQKLAALKANIAQANVDVWLAIFTIVELKGQIAFLNGLNTREGTFKEGSYGQVVDNVYKPALNTAFVHDEIVRAEAQIVMLQDQVDDYNHRVVI
jgi:hypothetical protein